MSSLLYQKKQEEDMRLKTVIEKLKNKGNKKISFKQLRNVDNDRLLKQQIEQYRMNEFRAKSQLAGEITSTSPNSRAGMSTSMANLGFSATEN